MPQYGAHERGPDLGTPEQLAVSSVPREELIAAVPRQRDSDALSRELRHQERRKRGGVTEWLIEPANHILEETISIRPDRQLGVARSERARHARGVRCLVERRVVEPDGKGLHR